MTMKFIQAYQQTPWRVQTRWIGRFLLVLVIAVMIAGLYLSISAQIAAANTEMINDEWESAALKRSIAHLGSQLASLTSAIEIKKRAEDMGFVFPEEGETIYVPVPGYSSPQPVTMAPPPGADMIAPPLIKPEYTKSLWEFLVENSTILEETQGGIK